MPALAERLHKPCVARGRAKLKSYGNICRMRGFNDLRFPKSMTKTRHCGVLFASRDALQSAFKVRL
jgi:hypothetical protein